MRRFGSSLRRGRVSLYFSTDTNNRAERTNRLALEPITPCNNDVSSHNQKIQTSLDSTKAVPLVFNDLSALVARQDQLAWEPFLEGVERHWIYRDADQGPAAALLRFRPGSRVPLHEHLGYEHIFVLNGSQTDENGTLRVGSLMIHPPGTRHSIVSEEGCLVLAIYEKRVRFVDPQTPADS